MDAILNALLENLRDQLIAHQDLLKALQEEGESIGKISGAKLLHLQSGKAQLTRRVAALEEQRIRIVETLAEGWEVSVTELNLRQIIARLSAESALPLQECWQQLKQVIERIQKVAERNSRLAEARLKPLELSLKFLGDLQKRQQTYAGDGSLQNVATKWARAAV